MGDGLTGLDVADSGPDGRSGRRRILVVANETLVGEALRETVEERARGYRAEAFVVCPALNSRLRHWLSDVDRALAQAQLRLEATMAALEELGIRADGRVGDADPVQAMEDALRVFNADEIVVSTHPPGRSNWLEKNVVERARGRFEVTITHVVVDLERERTETQDASASAVNE